MPFCPHDNYSSDAFLREAFLRDVVVSRDTFKIDAFSRDTLQCDAISRDAFL